MSSSATCYSLDGLILLLNKKEDKLSIQVKNTEDFLLFNKHISHEEAQKVGLGLFSDVEDLYGGLIEGLERINQSLSPMMNHDEGTLIFYNKVMKGGKEKWLEIVLPLKEKEFCSLALSSQSSENCEAETRPSSEKDTLKLGGQENKGNLKTAQEIAQEKKVQSSEPKPKSKLWWWQSAPHYSGLFE